MKFTFTEKRMDSSEELRAYSMKKIGKLDRLFKNEGEAYVTFSIERGRHKAEITIHNNGMFYRASELTNDMYASVDSGVAAIERQIRRNKTRLEKKLREGALEKEVLPAYETADDEAEEVRKKPSAQVKVFILPLTLTSKINFPQCPSTCTNYSDLSTGL